MSKRDELKEIKKHEIKSCALELFSETGYFHTSIEDIAIKSNVSKGLIYHYYSNKEALFEEVVFESFDTLLYYFPKNREKEFNDDSMHYFINRIIVTSLYKYEKHWRLLILLLSEQQLHKTVLKYLSKSSAYSEFESILTNYFSLKGYNDSGIEAKLFTSSLVGICIQYIINPIDYPVKSILSQFTNRVRASN